MASSQASGVFEADCDPISIEDEDCESGDVGRRIIESVFVDPDCREIFESFDVYVRLVGIEGADDFEAGRDALVSALKAFTDSGDEGGAEIRCVAYVRNISDHLADMDRVLSLDIFAKHLFDTWKMSATERKICEEFNGKLFAAMAAKAEPEELFLCMSKLEWDRFNAKKKEGKRIDGRSLLGKHDGRKDDKVFFRRVNEQIRKYAGKRLDTKVKLKLVSLFQDAQERGGYLYLGDIACTISCRKRGDASTFFFDIRKAGTRKVLAAGAMLPKELSVLEKDN